MSYTPTIWVDGQTPVNAENLNKMEQGIVEAGVYVLTSGETIEDAPAWATVVIDPDGEPSTVEMTVTLADGTTATYKVYGEAVTG